MVVAPATARLRSDRPSTTASRRVVSSNRRAFSIAPATRLAAWTRNSTSLWVNSLGASACSAMTPITSPDLAFSGAPQSDWYFSSSASGTILTRGSASAFSEMKTGWLLAATQPDRPSPGSKRSRPTSAPYGSDTARSTSELSGSTA